MRTPDPIAARVPMRVPDSPVPLKGFRVWGVTRTPEGPRLQSPTAGFLFAPLPVWAPNERFEARCVDLRNRCAAGDVPARGHRCGIYAVSTPGRAFDWADEIEHRTYVIGEVWSWGTVAEHAAGWRSRYAYPASFLEARTRGHLDDALTDELRTTYLAG
ncbi:MAG TPA: hypothetical protein VFK89_02980 [Actinomycetota bacterium]|nr:hypothetical protein [Actinomycetota bacterium]